MKLIEIIKKDRVNLLRKKAVKLSKNLVKERVGDFFRPKQIYPLHLACAFKSFKILEYYLEINLNWAKVVKPKKEYALDYFLIHLPHGVKKKEDYENFKRILGAVCRKYDHTDFFPLTKDLVETIYTSQIPNARMLELLKVVNRPLKFTQIVFLQKQAPQLFYELLRHPGSKALDNYPMLKNKWVYENTIVLLSGSNISDYEGFFKENSLKKSCVNFFGLDSKEFMKKSYPLICSSYSPKNIETYYGFVGLSVKLEMFNSWQAEYVEDLREIFLSREKPNFNDFLSLSARFSVGLEKNVLSFLKRTFKDEDIVTLVPKYNLSEKERHAAKEFSSSFKGLKEEQAKKMIKLIHSNPVKSRSSFVLINKNFKKSLLLIAAPNFKLNALSFYPALKKLQGKKIEGYTVKVAQNSHELVNWGFEMKHCVGNGDFARDINRGNVIILSLQKEGDDKYTISISPGTDHVDQAQGKSGKRPSDKIISSLESLLSQLGILKEEL